MRNLFETFLFFIKTFFKIVFFVNFSVLKKYHENEQFILMIFLLNSMIKTQAIIIVIHVLFVYFFIYVLFIYLFTYILAPVLGGPEAALSGKLSVMIGGEKEHVQYAEELINCYSSSIVHFGPSGERVTLLVAFYLILSN